MAEYRKRKRENQDTYEQYKASERERDREKRKCRRNWVKAKRSSRGFYVLHHRFLPRQMNTNMHLHRTHIDLTQ
ncbi:hypothetical protein MAR_027249 [Mya arenaria]|uniref:Uncharacterized protein n=1 Tax=Mya arenaria TaxID=6604 RepID=A0ABY7EXB6_MYAAR|nr:hypothetical protein MAR_027249 [Mya arenaria]